MSKRVVLQNGTHAFGANTYKGDVEVSLNDVEYAEAKNAGKITWESDREDTKEELLKRIDELLVINKKLESQLAEYQLDVTTVTEEPTPKMTYPELKKLALGKGYKGKDMKAVALREYLDSL